MERLEFETTSNRLEDGTVVVAVVGELDLYTVPQLEEVLFEAEGIAPVVVDLSDCTFIDSAALGILLAAKRRLGVAIVASSPEIRRPFELHESLASALNGGAR